MKARLIPVIATLLLAAALPAQWPSTVQSGDKITAAGWNEIVSALQTWGGDTDANGHALTNLDHVELVPRALPATPAAGTLLSDSADGNKLKFYDGSTWLSFTAPAGSTGQYQYNSAGALAAGTLYECSGVIGFGGCGSTDAGIKPVSGSTPTVDFRNADDTVWETVRAANYNAFSTGIQYYFGGATSSYPALKRTGANLEVRLGDDSGYAILYADRYISSSPDARIVFYETDAPADEKYWQLLSVAGDFQLKILDDSYANPTTVLDFTRTGTTPDAGIFYGSTWRVNNAAPALELYDADAATDEKSWRFYLNDGALLLQTLDDSRATSADIFKIDRTGTSVTAVVFNTKIQSSRTFPNIEWYESDAGTDRKYWRSVMANGQWRLETVNDAYTTSSPALTVDRNGNSTLNYQFYVNSTLQVIISGDGLKIYDTGSRPTCSSTTRGYIWRDEGGSGVADTVEICVKLADGSYVWKSMI